MKEGWRVEWRSKRRREDRRVGGEGVMEKWREGRGGEEWGEEGEANRLFT